MLTQLQQERFTQLWTAAQPTVTGYLHAVVRDSAAAQDLVQETALVVLRRFAEYDEARPFLPWALGVAKFQVLSFRRDAARSLVTCDADLFDRFTRTWAEVTPALSAESSALQACLDRLAQRARQVIQLRYFEGLGSEGIAQRLGAQAGAIRVLLQRVREQLRVCVERALRLEGEAP